MTNRATPQRNPTAGLAVFATGVLAICFGIYVTFGVGALIVMTGVGLCACGILLT